MESKGWMPALHPDDERRVIEEWYEALTEERGFSSQYRLRHASGRVVWVYCQTRPDVKEDAVAGYVGTLTDVTRQKLAEESLRVLNAALEQATVAIAVLTAEDDPRLVYTNPAFSQMTGYLPDELIGKPPRIFFGPATDQDAVDRLRRLLGAADSFTCEIAGHRRDSTAFAAVWQLDPVRDGGELTHWVAIVRESPSA